GKQVLKHDPTASVAQYVLEQELLKVQMI
ncbi:hypothetical protein EVA_00423, partial [gut metagenome]